MFKDNLTSRPTAQIKKSQWRTENRFWLNQSSSIAVAILFRLKEMNWSKKDLAKALNRSESDVDKMVKGQYNFTLSTLCKIEKAIGIYF